MDSKAIPNLAQVRQAHRYSARRGAGGWASVVVVFPLARQAGHSGALHGHDAGGVGVGFGRIGAGGSGRDALHPAQVHQPHGRVGSWRLRAPGRDFAHRVGGDPDRSGDLVNREAGVDESGNAEAPVHGQ